MITVLKKCNVVDSEFSGYYAVENNTETSKAQSGKMYFQMLLFIVGMCLATPSFKWKETNILTKHNRLKIHGKPVGYFEA